MACSLTYRGWGLLIGCRQFGQCWRFIRRKCTLIDVSSYAWLFSSKWHILSCIKGTLNSGWTQLWFVLRYIFALAEVLAHLTIHSFARRYLHLLLSRDYNLCYWHGLNSCTLLLLTRNLSWFLIKIELWSGLGAHQGSFNYSIVIIMLLC